MLCQELQRTHETKMKAHARSMEQMRTPHKTKRPTWTGIRADITHEATPLKVHKYSSMCMRVCLSEFIFRHSQLCFYTTVFPRLWVPVPTQTSLFPEEEFDKGSCSGRRNVIISIIIVLGVICLTVSVGSIKGAQWWSPPPLIIGQDRWCAVPLSRL